MTITWGNITYRVVVTGNENYPYELHGPRGASYSLLRNQPHPEMLFAINNRRFGVVKGLPWFTDRNGTLEVV